MTIKYLGDTTEKFIQIEGPELTAMVVDIDSFAAITLQGIIGCNVIGAKELKLTVEQLQDNSGLFYLEGNKLIVKPLFFQMQSFTDSIIKFTLKLHKQDASYYQFSNCAFIDVTYGCKVAALLHNIVTENETKGDNEKISTVIHIMHYGLVNGSQCGCNCEELCVLLNDLTRYLNSVDSKIQNDCGCQ